MIEDNVAEDPQPKDVLVCNAVAINACPIVPFKVAAPALTETILYHPGIEFVPDLIKTQDPTSPATNEYEALEMIGEAVLALVIDPLVIKPEELISNPPELFVSLPVVLTSKYV